MWKSVALTIGTAGHYAFRVVGERAKPIAYAPRPTFLTRAGEGLYGVGEIGHGQVFRISGEELPEGVMLGSLEGGAVVDGLSGEAVPSGGAHPCHISAHPGGHWLYVSNYGDGTVRAIQLTSSGEFGETIDLPHEGSGPNAGRQSGPHAHSSMVVEGHLVIADLGTDELRVHELDGGAPRGEPEVIAMPAGSGPRHFAQHDGALIVAGELDGSLSEVDLASRRVLRSVPAATASGEHYLSHIIASGGLLFVGVRGSNTISVLDEDLRIVQEVPTAAWPRHFALARDGLIVAGERSDEVVWHPLSDDPQPLGGITDRLAVPTPMFIGIGEEF